MTRHWYLIRSSPYCPAQGRTRSRISGLKGRLRTESWLATAVCSAETIRLVQTAAQLRLASGGPRNQHELWTSAQNAGIMERCRSCDTCWQHAKTAKACARTVDTCCVAELVLGPKHIYPESTNCVSKIIACTHFRTRHMSEETLWRFCRKSALDSFSSNLVAIDIKMPVIQRIAQLRPSGTGWTCMWPDGMELHTPAPRSSSRLTQVKSRHNKETETLLHISPQRRPVNTSLELEESMEVVA